MINFNPNSTKSLGNHTRIQVQGNCKLTGTSLKLPGIFLDAYRHYWCRTKCL